MNSNKVNTTDNPNDVKCENVKEEIERKEESTDMSMS